MVITRARNRLPIQFSLPIDSKYVLIYRIKTVAREKVSLPEMAGGTEGPRTSADIVVLMAKGKP